MVINRCKRVLFSSDKWQTATRDENGRKLMFDIPVNLWPADCPVILSTVHPIFYRTCESLFDHPGSLLTLKDVLLGFGAGGGIRTPPSHLPI